MTSARDPRQSETDQQPPPRRPINTHTGHGIPRGSDGVVAPKAPTGHGVPCGGGTVVTPKANFSRSQGTVKSHRTHIVQVQFGEQSSNYPQRLTLSGCRLPVFMSVCLFVLCDVQYQAIIQDLIVNARWFHFLMFLFRCSFQMFLLPCSVSDFPFQTFILTGSFSDVALQMLIFLFVLSESSFFHMFLFR